MDGPYVRLIEANRRRRASSADEALEAALDREYACGTRLAVYGSLAPGEANAHVLASLQGSWIAALFVNGDLSPDGWGATLGFPGGRWRVDGPPFPVQLFSSPRLAGDWPRLDAFEGPEYLRILVPVFSRDGFATVANLYAVA
jgi:gamma-glutamylcyclotransferase (GGCT)/AIG2-like uncharacterized protein YtfP